MIKELNKIENIAYRILIEPWITEATTLAAELNKYVFKVAKSATKQEVKEVIESLYKVSVLNVRTINIPAKKKTRGRIVGRKSGFKKAIITLKKGDSIDLFGNK
jgi:large subunit ribosomal protein L23